MAMIRVLHLTDTHVVAAEDLARPPSTFAGAVAAVQGRSTSDLLRLVLDAVTTDGFDPDVVLHTGDAADDGEPASYVRLRELLGAIDAPVLAVAGNHDRADQLAVALGQEPDAVRSTDLDGWRLVLLDTSIYDRDHGEVLPDALEAFEQAIATAPGAVLVGLHHPPISACDEPSCQLRQADAVLAILDRDPNVRAVVSGHLHVTDDIHRNGVDYLLSPSSCLQLHHHHPLREHNTTPTPVGARLLELHDDGRVSSRLLWV